MKNVMSGSRVRRRVRMLGAALRRVPGGSARGAGWKVYASAALAAVLAVGPLTVGQAAASSGDVPEAPQNIDGVALHLEIVSLDWDDVTDADSYKIEYFDGHGWLRLPSAVHGILAIFDGSSVILDGLESERRVEVRIRAINSAGASEWSGTYSMPATGTGGFGGVPRPRLEGTPSVPTSVVASAEQHSRIDIIWVAPQDTGTSAITDYRVEYSLNPDSQFSWELLGHTGGPATMMSHEGVQSRRSYAYRVSAINDSGRGPNSVAAIGSAVAPSDRRRHCDVAPEHEISMDSALVPSGHGLDAGDRFRLLFLTSQRRNAVPTDIDAYDAFVQDVASRGTVAIQPYASDFRVIGSTKAVSARSNSCTEWTEEDLGHPIYWLGDPGERVADDYRDFYDGNWDNARKINEHGQSGGFDFDYRIATGSTHDGSPKKRVRNEFPDDPVRVEEVGSLPFPCPWVTLGAKSDQSSFQPACQDVETGASTEVTNPPCYWNVNWGDRVRVCDRWGPLEDAEGHYNGFEWEWTWYSRGKNIRDQFYYYAMSPVFRIEGGCDSLWCGNGTVQPASEAKHQASITSSNAFAYDAVAYTVSGFSADLSANQVSLTVSPSPAANAFDFLTLNSDELRLRLMDAEQSGGTFTWTAPSWIGTDGGLFSDNAAFRVTLDVDLVPGAPTELSAQGRGRETIDLQWAAPIDPGGGAISGYRIELSLDGGYNWNVLVPDTGTTATTWTHSGLSAGARNHYAVSAINGAGFGPRSDTAFGATTPARVPDRPINVVLTKADDEPHFLVWDAPPDDGGAAVTDYVVERSWDGELWERLPKRRAGEILQLGTYYLDDVQLDRSLRYYRVSAVNRIGTGPARVILRDGTAVITPPDKPTRLSLERDGGLVELNWVPPADNGGGVITGYKVESSLNCIEWDVSESKTTETSYSEDAPPEGVMYCFRVAAVNAAGPSVEYAMATSAGTVPGAPEELWASATETTITLSWQTPADDGGADVTDYHVKWSPDGIDWTQLAVVKTTDPDSLELTLTRTTETYEYTYTDLTASTEYHYRVAALNSVGASTWAQITQSTEPDADAAATWSAMMTVGASQLGADAFYGYSIFNPGTRLGSLTSSWFSIDENNYTVGVVAVVGDTLWLTLSSAPADTFTFAVRDQQFSSADATVRHSIYSVVYQWPGTALYWFETDIVNVSLTVNTAAEEAEPTGLPGPAE